MNFRQFQEACKRTENPSLSPNEKACNWALGIAGEAGEVVELIKKNQFHAKGLDLDDLVKEVGDVLYYLAALCNLYGLSLEDVAERNVVKLLERYPNGFQAAINGSLPNNDHEDDGN